MTCNLSSPDVTQEDLASILARHQAIAVALKGEIDERAKASASAHRSPNLMSKIENTVNIVNSFRSQDLVNALWLNLKSLDYRYGLVGRLRTDLKKGSIDAMIGRRESLSGLEVAWLISKLIGPGYSLLYLLTYPDRSASRLKLPNVCEVIRYLNRHRDRFFCPVLNTMAYELGIFVWSMFYPH